MILIKLGGSVITNKSKPFTPRKTTINKIVSSFKKIDESFVIVHGGGSYGHYWSVKYGMHTKPAKYSIRGISIVKNSLLGQAPVFLENAMHEGQLVFTGHRSLTFIGLCLSSEV